MHPGFLHGQGVPWATAYFGMPTIVSLYMLNPMLPALGVLAAVLLCLRHFMRGEAWVASPWRHPRARARRIQGLRGDAPPRRARDRRGRGLLARPRPPAARLRGALWPHARSHGARLLGGGIATRVQILLRSWPYVSGLPGSASALWDAPWLAPLRAAAEGVFDLPGFAQYLFVGRAGVRARRDGRPSSPSSPSCAPSGRMCFAWRSPSSAPGSALDVTCSIVVPGLFSTEQ